eukprot:gene30184-39383_t
MRLSTVVIRSTSFIRRNSVIYPLKRRLSSASNSKQPLDIFSINFDRLKDIDEEFTNEIEIKLPAQNVALFDKEVLVDEGGIAIYDTETLSIATRYFSPALISALKNLSEEDMVAFLACMCILLPSEKSFWKELDELLANQIPQCSFNCSLFCAYVISSSTEKLHHHGQWKTPEAVLKQFLQKRREFKGLGFLIDNSRNVGKFAEIGATDVSDSYAIEQLGLLLHLLATKTIDRKVRGSIISDLSTHSFRVLLSIHSPIKFATFRMLWCNAPVLNFQESYVFYKSLYQQILYSVNASPLHAFQQTEDVVGLLSSMVAVKFKDPLLIDRLCGILQEREIKTNDKITGIKVFSLLLQLDCLHLALPFIQKLLQGNNGSVKKNSSWLLHNSLALSTTAQNALCKVLNERPNPDEFTCAELVLLVVCNNPNLTKSGGNFRVFLKKVESHFLPKIAGLPPVEVVNILQAYAIGARLYLPMIREIEKCLPLWTVSDLSLEEVTTILWSLAKLNHIRGDHINAYIDSFLQSIQLMTSATFDTALERVILGLWSLAVMDKLRLEHAKLVLPQLQQFVAAKSKQLPDKVVRQLQQVLLDLKLKAQKTGEEIDLSKFAIVGRERDPNWREQDKALSSFSHLDVSKRLTDSMIADIYIPIENIPETMLGNWAKEKNAGTLGLVIEYDGPSHFDSYSMRQPLGTTLMKRRHIA